MNTAMEGLYYVGISIAAGAFVSSAIFVMVVVVVFILKPLLKKEDDE